MTAMASVFARKQIHNLPSLDIRNDMLAVVDSDVRGIDVREFNDVDELFRSLSNFMSPELLGMLGLECREILLADDGEYVINAGNLFHYSVLNVMLPDDVQNHDLNELIAARLFTNDIRPYDMFCYEHEEYFAKYNINPDEHIVLKMDAQLQTRITSFSPILPIHIPRIKQRENSLLQDEIAVPEFLYLTGTPRRYTLFSFVVFEHSHYWAYVRSADDLKWYRHNDEDVEEVSTSSFRPELQTKSVLLFYFSGLPVTPEIPPILEFFAKQMNMRQHMRSELTAQVKHLARK